MKIKKIMAFVLVMTFVVSLLGNSSAVFADTKQNNTTESIVSSVPPSDEQAGSDHQEEYIILAKRDWSYVELLNTVLNGSAVGLIGMAVYNDILSFCKKPYANLVASFASAVVIGVLSAKMKLLDRIVF